jgi:hypothetical protein
MVDNICQIKTKGATVTFHPLFIHPVRMTFFLSKTCSDDWMSFTRILRIIVVEVVVVGKVRNGVKQVNTRMPPAN